MTGRVIREPAGTYRYDADAVTPLPEGTRVRVKADAQPIYLRGRTGTVKRARVVYEIAWDEPDARAVHLPSALQVAHEYLESEHGR